MSIIELTFLFIKIIIAFALAMGVIYACIHIFLTFIANSSDISTATHKVISDFVDILFSPQKSGGVETDQQSVFKSFRLSSNNKIIKTNKQAYGISIIFGILIFTITIVILSNL